MEDTTDFDPTTEEGQADINEEEAESLLPDPSESPMSIWKRLADQFGDKARTMWDKLRNTRRGSHMPPYMQLEMESLSHIGRVIREDPISKAKERLQERYENINFDDIKLTNDKGVIKIQVRNQKDGKWTKAEKLFNENGEIRQRVENLKGFQIASRGLLGGLEEVNKRMELEDRIEVLAREKYIATEAARRRAEEYDAKLQGKDETIRELRSRLDNDHRAQEQYANLLDEHNREIIRMTAERESEKKDIIMNAQEEKDALREELRAALARRAEADRRLRAAIGEIDEFDVERAGFDIERGTLEQNVRAALEERNILISEKDELIREINIKEEQLRQREQAIEDLEQQIEVIRQKMTEEGRTEEEIEEAGRTMRELYERIDELREQKEKLERELGLTTKEKIKRALLKYGIPLAFAVGISSAVGVIINLSKATGNGIKKVGQGLTDLGKKMAASIPGLLGSVLSLVLRTGGELLKFVGNNIWILVVALGAVLLKRMSSG